MRRSYLPHDFHIGEPVLRDILGHEKQSQYFLVFMAYLGWKLLSSQVHSGMNRDRRGAREFDLKIYK